MQDNAFLKQMKICTDAEIKAFKKFLASPYFEGSKNLVLLYDFIYKYAPTFQSNKFTKENAHARIFPNKTFVARRIDDLLRDLRKTLEHFWYIESVKNNEIDKNLILAKLYHKRNLNHFAEQKIEQNEKLIQSNLKKDIHLFNQDLKHQITLHESITYMGIRDKEPNLQKVLNSLNLYYIVNGLKYYYKSINIKTFIADQSYDFDFWNLVIDDLEKKDPTNYPIIVRIYLLAVQIAKEPKEATYIKLRDLIYQHFNDFAKTELEEMFAVLHNYLIGQINKGNRALINDLFETYQFELKNEIILEDGKIRASIFKNITTVAHLANQLDWLKYFLENYQNAVSDEEYALSLAQLYFKQERYTEIIELFSTRDYQDIFYKLRAYCNQIMAYYEIWHQNDDPDDLEKLENRLYAFILFLSRNNKNLPKHSLYYRNFTRYMKQFLRILLEPRINQENLKKLETEIREATQVQEKRWLLQKIKSLQ